MHFITFFEKQNRCDIKIRVISKKKKYHLHWNATENQIMDEIILNKIGIITSMSVSIPRDGYNTRICLCVEKLLVSDKSKTICNIVGGIVRKDFQKNLEEFNLPNPIAIVG